MNVFYLMKLEGRGGVTNCVHAACCTTIAAGTPLYREQTVKGEKTEKKKERKTIK